jgi:hypothetical protein
MKGILLLIALALTCAATAQARIGWTERQCEDQYGTGMRETQNTRESGINVTDRLSRIHFRKNSVEMIASFVDGICFCISYRNMDREWTTAEIMQILRKNYDKAWEEDKESRVGDREWWAKGDYMKAELKEGKLTVHGASELVQKANDARQEWMDKKSKDGAAIAN